ncbi:MAG: hypothetical protein NUK65_06135 [Firmicutes bacterium]|nr:hypothetical protein [Bacillota bacterium]
MLVTTSINERPILAHSFKMAMKACIVPTTLSLLAFITVLIVVMSNSHVRRLTYPYTYHFFFYSPALAPFVVGIIVVSAAMCAIAIFSFIFNKDAVTVFFSLGLSRKQLFMTRYLAGLFMSIAPIIIFMLLTFLVNFQRAGAVRELTIAASYLLLGFMIVSVAAFSITCLLCTCCGTVSEGILLSISGLGGMSLLLLGLNHLMKLLLWGNPYGQFSEFYSPVTESLLHHSTAINPLLFFLQDAITFSRLELGNLISFTLPVLLSRLQGALLFTWLAVSILLTMLALKVFTRRKVEIAGIAGASRFISLISTFIPTFFAFTFVAASADHLVSRTLAFIIATIAGVLVYALTEIAFRKLPFRTNHFKLASVVSLCMLCVIILSTGGLGFTSRVPALHEIEHVSISYVGSPDYRFLKSDEDFVRYHAGSMGDWYSFATDIKYADTADIPKVLAVHQSIIKYGNQPVTQTNRVESPLHHTIDREICIKYKLKDGGELVRYYPTTTVHNLIQVLRLDDTNTIRNKINASLEYEHNASFVIGDIYLTDIFYASDFKYQPDKDTRSRLLEALRVDIAQETSEQRYFPKQAALGVIVFCGPLGARTREDRYGIFDLSSTKFFITEDYTETIAFLKEENLFQHFAIRDELTAMEVGRYLLHPQFQLRDAKHHYFRSFTLNDSRRFNVEANSAMTISDPAEQEEILSRIRTNYFAAEGGYVVRVHFNGKVPTYLFLPEKDAPDFVKNM